MQRILYYFIGSVRVKTECRYPERVINICAANGISFRDLERDEDGSAYMTLTPGDYKKLRNAAKRSGVFTVKLIKKTGVPFFLKGLRKRYALFSGMFVFLSLLWVSSLFVWQINVTGNEKISDAEILSRLSELGVGIGTCRLTISQEYISNEMLQIIPELSWITVNTHGSRAEVKVREEIPVPYIPDRDKPSMVVAEKAGIITGMTVREGKRILKPGDTVSAGETIVTGVMDSISSGRRAVHADAEVRARTWYTLSAAMPLHSSKKEYTGEETVKTALILGGKRINLYFSGGNNYKQYDKITMYDILKLPDGTVLPLTVLREVSSEYIPLDIEVSRDAARRLLEARLTAKLEGMIDGGSITSLVFYTAEDGGTLTVTMKAECREQIGIVREMTEEETASAGKLPAGGG